MRNSLKKLAAPLAIAAALGFVPEAALPALAQTDDMSIHAGSVEVPVNKS